MVEIKRMRKILMLITSVRVKNSAKLMRMFIGQFLKGNSMGRIKIHIGRNYAHSQDSNTYNFCYSENSTFSGQFLKGNSMGTIKIHNGRNYAHVNKTISCSKR